VNQVAQDQNYLGFNLCVRRVQVSLSQELFTPADWDCANLQERLDCDLATKVGQSFKELLDVLRA
jgi:hypothetical protein